MNTCKSCAYWVDARKNDFGEPMNQRPWTKECHCRKLTEPMGASYDAAEEEAKDLLIYSYDEGGGFSTGPNFGCVHHRGELPQGEKS